MNRWTWILDGLEYMSGIAFALQYSPGDTFIYNMSDTTLREHDVGGVNGTRICFSDQRRVFAPNQQVHVTGNVTTYTTNRIRFGSLRLVRQYDSAKYPLMPSEAEWLRKQNDPVRITITGLDIYRDDQGVHSSLSALEAVWGARSAGPNHVYLYGRNSHTKNKVSEISIHKSAQFYDDRPMLPLLERAGIDPSRTDLESYSYFADLNDRFLFLSHIAFAP